MTPRTVMLSFPTTCTVGEVMQTHRLLPFSRIPIYDQSPDDTNAFVLRSDILSAAAEDRDSVTLAELARPLHPIPETMTVDKVMAEFVSRHEHIFLVFDEFGGTAGIITLEDAVESLLGVEITDESDLVADLRLLAQQRYQRQAKLLGFARDDTLSSAPDKTTGLDPSI
jgi:CBS domain containing-hemolysin-like protein